MKTLPWKRVAVLAAGMFVVVLLAITAFEVLTGESVSSRTGGSDGQGTTIGGVTNDDNGSKNNQDQQPAGQDQPSDEATPSESPANESPSASPTETPTASPTEPTESVAPNPTPTPTPSPTPSVTATP